MYTYSINFIVFVKPKKLRDNSNSISEMLAPVCKSFLIKITLNVD